MRIIQKTDSFLNWIEGLRDLRAKAIIMKRLDRAIAGNLGDVKWVGEGVSELRIDYGPGYRIYFVELGSIMIILLCGGDKSTQDRDVRRAKIMAMDLRRSKL
jgi:putative addiction module killer protein